MTEVQSNGVLGFFLKAYRDRSFTAQMQSKILLYMILSAMVLLPIYLIVNILKNGPLTSLLGICGAFLMMIPALLLLKYGRYIIVSNFLLTSLFTVIWGVMLTNSDMQPVSRLDTVALILGVMAIAPVLVGGKNVIAFGILNFVVFLLFTQTVAGDLLQLPRNVLVDYISDNTFALALCIISGFMVNYMNDRALKITEEGAIKNRDQYLMLKRIYESLNSAAPRLAAHSSQLADQANAFLDKAQSQASSIEEISSTLEEVASGMDLSSSNVGTQHQNLATLTQKIETLSSTIVKVAEKIDLTLGLTDRMAGVADRGSQMLELMNQSLVNVNESSSRMTAIIEMIGDISDRTNLLSLNAAIEAARAGEAGRGFAVVADHISRLADQTASSIKEISQLIERNITEIARGRSNVEGTIQTISEIIEGVTLINARIDEVARFMEEANTTNKSVTQDAAVVLKVSNQIEVGIGEQKVAMDEITKSISEINRITQIYTDGSEQLSKNSVAMRDMVDHFQQLMSDHDENRT